MASVYLLHRDPELFADPEEFRPERFLDGGPESGSWIPFGGGVRRCLGASFAQLEMKVVLRTVLAHARLSAPDPRPRAGQARALHLRARVPREAMVEVRAPTSGGAGCQGVTRARKRPRCRRFLSNIC